MAKIPLIPKMTVSPTNGISVIETNTNRFYPQLVDRTSSTSVRIAASYPTVRVTFPKPTKVTAVMFDALNYGYMQLQGRKQGGSFENITQYSTANARNVNIDIAKVEYVEMQFYFDARGKDSANAWVADIYEIQVYTDSPSVLLEIDGKVCTVINKAINVIGNATDMTKDLYLSASPLFIKDLHTEKIIFNGKEISLLQYLQENHPKYKLHYLEAL